jgi:hypothetical protein
VQQLLGEEMCCVQHVGGQVMSALQVVCSEAGAVSTSSMLACKHSRRTYVLPWHAAAACGRALSTASQQPRRGTLCMECDSVL